MGHVLRAGSLAATYVLLSLTLTAGAGLPAFAMSFASSSILLATQPDTPAAQPRSLVGGHLIAALCGYGFATFAGPQPWSAALAIGLAAMLMLLTRTLHPPGAVSGYLMFNAHQHPEWIVFPVLTTSLMLAVLSALVRRYIPARARR
jgi:CBS-domain-containing membrane protein